MLLDDEQKEFFSVEEMDKSKLLTELRELRVENEILKERLIQIEQLTAL